MSVRRTRWGGRILSALPSCQYPNRTFCTEPDAICKPMTAQKCRSEHSVTQDTDKVKNQYACRSEQTYDCNETQVYDTARTLACFSVRNGMHAAVSKPMTANKTGLRALQTIRETLWQSGLPGAIREPMTAMECRQQAAARVERRSYIREPCVCCRTVAYDCSGNWSVKRTGPRSLFGGKDHIMTKYLYS